MADNTYEEAAIAWGRQLSNREDVVSIRFEGLPGTYGCDSGCEYVWPGVRVFFADGTDELFRVPGRGDLPEILRALENAGDLRGEFGDEPEDFGLNGRTVAEVMESRDATRAGGARLVGGRHERGN